MPRKKAAPPEPFVLHVVSDATGNLASHMVHAVITQFPDVPFQLNYHVLQDTPAKLAATLAGFKGKRNLVFHALLSDEMKQQVREHCHTKGVGEFDLTGELTRFLARHVASEPVNQLARLHNTDESYFRRIRAMEFTAQHDDNRRLESIAQADVVIVGLSRVSKSPTSTWLGSLGYKVANVAIARETGFPAELDAVQDRTVAFTTRPRALWETRRRRFEGFQEKIEEKNLDELPYYNLAEVVKEVAWADGQYRKRGYPIIDIHERTVEELGALVLNTLKIPKRHDKHVFLG